MSSPTDDELLLVLKALHVDQPELGLGKTHGYLKENYKEWTVSSKVGKESLEHRAGIMTETFYCSGLNCYGTHMV